MFLCVNKLKYFNGGLKKNTAEVGIYICMYICEYFNNKIKITLVYIVKILNIKFVIVGYSSEFVSL